MSKQKQNKEFLSLARKCLKFSISKDQTRPSLMGVCHAPDIKALTSTNGHVLTALPALFENDLEGKIIDSDFRLIERDFPRLNGIFPDISKAKITGEISISKSIALKNKKPIFAYLNKNKENNTYFFTHDSTVNTLIAINSYYLKPLEGFTFDFYFFDEHRPLVFSLSRLTEFRNNIYLIMPVKNKGKGYE
jgi:hypothetical protein